MSCQPQEPYLTKNLEYFTGMMKGLVWSTTICDINIDNTNTRNNNNIIPNLPPQSWLTPWGYQIKPVPNSDELEEVILLHKKDFLDQKKSDQRLISRQNCFRNMTLNISRWQRRLSNRSEKLRVFSLVLTNTSDSCQTWPNQDLVVGDSPELMMRCKNVDKGGL